MSNTYTYNKKTQIMRRATTQISLRTTTIKYADDEPWHAIGDGDFYVFLDFMNHIHTTPELIDALLKNPYYTKQYLRTSLGIYNTPNENDIFRIFLSFLLPYEAVYREIVTKPDYAKRILVEYDKNNNKFPRKFKEIVRGVLCIIYILFIPSYSLCE